MISNPQLSAYDVSVAIPRRVQSSMGVGCLRLTLLAEAEPSCPLPSGFSSCPVNKHADGLLSAVFFRIFLCYFAVLNGLQV